MQLHLRELPKYPRKVEDLLSAELTSGDVVDPQELGLGGIQASFLLPLANALDTAVIAGLDMARHIGWDGERHFWRLGQLYRVHYVPATERPSGYHEPDEFHRGIAPSVKLLHAVVSRLAEGDAAAAIAIAQRWKLTNSPIHLRLWVSLSCNPLITSASEVGAFLLALDKKHFWSIQDYPEVAELRSIRFSELSPESQAAVAARIIKLPPRKQWPKDAALDESKRRDFIGPSGNCDVSKSQAPIFRRKPRRGWSRK